MDVTAENIGWFRFYYIGNSNTMHNFGDGDAGFQNGKELLIKFWTKEIHQFSQQMHFGKFSEEWKNAKATQR